MSSIQNTSVNRNYGIKNKRYRDVGKQFLELLNRESDWFYQLSERSDRQFLEIFVRIQDKFIKNRIKLNNLRSSTLPAFILQNYCNKIFKTQRRIIKELEDLIWHYKFEGLIWDYY